jgi:cell division protein FtsQ
MKEYRTILFGMALIAYLVVVSGFISTMDRSRKISRVEIHIADSARNPFIRTSDVCKMIDATSSALPGASLQSVDVRKIEASLRSRQIIRKAEVYYTLPGVLHIDIRQKSPFVRITNAKGQTYYLDGEGNIIPASIKYSPYVLS